MSVQVVAELVDPPVMGDPITDYRRHLTRRALQPSTIDRYTGDLAAFARWLDPRDVLEATHDDIESFLDTRDLQPRARYRWLSQLHRFYQWAVNTQRIDLDPTVVIDRPRLSRLLPRPVDDNVLRDAMRTAGPQMRAWLALAAYAGFRCVEIARLDRPSIGPDALRVVGKGSHERVVPAHPVVLEALAAASLARSGPVFRKEGGQPFTAKEVSRRGALYFELIGHPGVTMHQLRHNFGTRVYRYSRDLRAVQELLGHARIDTSAGYAAVGAEDLRAAVAALPAL